MALFGRKARPVSGLLTCTVSAKQDRWIVFWIGDGIKEPPDFDAESLTEATTQAIPMALAMLASRPPSAGGELQFIIYPWDYGTNAACYEISGSAGQFTARDADGGEREIAGASMEDLVDALRREPGGDQAMLHWILPLAELSGV